MYNHQQRYMGSGSPSTSRPRGALSASSSTGALTTWADWAAKSLDPDAITTPLQMQIERCCDPSNREPNLALNLELADYIKDKKANSPREAAVEIVRRINSRHPHVSMLALQLLDILVKNCGYPFHLQIATKEFLNELVKRFPERPPVFPSPIQTKILELIQEWKVTICMTSKHREDLAHIRDMHRLLGYKGYRFPNVDSRAAGVMNVETNTLRSPEELEEEDRAAQGAKLQELIRRGTPRDLAQAQELMKIMSGAEPESKPDYSEQTRNELNKVQSRAILLNNMLDNANEGEKFAKGDAYDQIASHLRSVQPRLQKWIEEGEEGETEHMDRLLLINDLINNVNERYQSFKRGDFTASVTIDPSIDPSKGGADAVPTAKITDLISFDDEQDAATADKGSGAAAAAPSSSSASIMDDFASLTFGAPASSSGVNNGGSNGGSAKVVPNSSLPLDLFSSSSSSMPPSQPPSNAQQSNMIDAPLGQWGALQLPMNSNNNNNNTTTTKSTNSFNNGRSTPSLASQTKSGQTPASSAPSQSSADPFADLSRW
ncbi:hypothetical protein CBS101457_006203 [Exobasidium rhododendri]|nr:hypothetical protein CBS101457_006203 [Exobasidium rhododendri]